MILVFCLIELDLWILFIIGCLFCCCLILWDNWFNVIIGYFNLWVNVFNVWEILEIFCCLLLDVCELLFWINCK